MPNRWTNVTRNAGALLLLTACTWFVELLALAFVWRGQVLPPYAFFPNQSYDFLAKIRWFASDLLSWAPGLPDHFAGLAAGAKLATLSALLPATLVTAVPVALVGAALVTLLRRPRGGLRAHVLFWSVVALVVHFAATLPALGLEEGLRVSHLAYRARSLILDGMLLALLVSVAASVLASSLAPKVERSRPFAIAGLVAMFVSAVFAPAPPAAPAAAAKAASSSQDPSRPRRNVVLISLDSLRADHVGAYGYSRDTSPNFDRFAKEGVLFRNAFATSPWTLPTHMTMFTGRSQLSHGVAEDTRILSTAIPTLGQIFQAAGYSTAGFVSGPYLAGHYGYKRGMETYIDLSEAYGKGPEARAAVLSPEINTRALDWLDQNGDKPFFLFLHYFDIHYDFVPPPPYDTMFDPDYTGTMDGRRFIERKDVHPGMDKRDLDHIRALYDGEIRFTDAHVGRILDRLREKGRFEDTVVMILADHGDEFFEHGNKGHHRTVYDEVLHIPFALRLPDGTGAGTSVDAQVSLIDVLPTLLDAAGLPPHVDAEGESLAAWLRGDRSSRDAVYAEFFYKRGFNLQVARRTPVSKTIQHFNRITHPTRSALEYYDLVDDPQERDDRTSDHAAKSASSLETMSVWLDAQWQAQRRAEQAAGGRESIEIDDETMERLKSLGYVGE